MKVLKFVMLVLLISLNAYGAFTNTYDYFIRGDYYRIILITFVYMAFFSIITYIFSINTCKSEEDICNMKNDHNIIINPTFKVGDRVKLLFMGEGVIDTTYDNIDSYLVIYKDKYYYINSKGQMEQVVYIDPSLKKNKNILTPYSIIAKDNEKFYDVKVGDMITYVNEYKEFETKVVETNLNSRTFKTECGKEFNLEGVEMSPNYLISISMVIEKAV